VEEKRKRSRREEKIVGLEVVLVCVRDSLRLSSVPWLTITTGGSTGSAGVGQRGTTSFARIAGLKRAAGVLTGVVDPA
jgi:hypothetical protein